ncbi:3417_t:CDS:1, partial [Acaulospora colombiana]
MLEIAYNNYKGRSSRDHKDHKFLLIPGGVGIGKTRMGWESQYLLSSVKSEDYDNDDFKEALKDPCYIFIDSNDRFRYTSGLDNEVESSVRIGARVAVASGLVSENLATLINKNIQLFNLSDVIYEIVKRRIIMKQRSIDAIIIHLDEYQIYISDTQKRKNITWTQARDFFKLMLREIGSVMRGNTMTGTENGLLFHDLRGKYFIIPI